MRTKILSLATLFILGAVSVFAGNKIEKFKVFGTCGTCENAIEMAAIGVSGVKSADWNEETQLLAVSFENSKTGVHKIHMAIAKTGHDTEMHKASDEDYNKLNACCKYERTGLKMEMKSYEGHSH